LPFEDVIKIIVTTPLCYLDSWAYAYGLSKFC